MADLIVYFKKPTDWANTLHIHFWDTRPPVTLIDWPGMPMSATENDWFVYRFSGVSTSRLLFHDGQGRQTIDLQRDHLGWYTLEGGWFNDNPDASSPPGESGAGGGGPSGDKLTVKTQNPQPAVLTGKDFREETIY
ncbi:MAG TPA: starch-binding protein, partial [Candidatus Competibacter sp.]|nr:starch-binding protein [Candidatus Competibacter sp.]